MCEVGYIWDCSPTQLQALLDKRFPDIKYKGKILKGNLYYSLNDPIRESFQRQIDYPEQYYKLKGGRKS